MERLGIVEERQANRIKYARFAYVAPQDRVFPDKNPTPEKPRVCRPAGLDGGIVADFDTGMSRRDIADKYGVDYGRVSRVLFKHRRTEKTRCSAELTGDQRKLFLVLVECGVPVAQAYVAARQASR